MGFFSSPSSGCCLLGVSSGKLGDQPSLKGTREAVGLAFLSSVQDAGPHDLAAVPAVCFLQTAGPSVLFFG